MATATQPKRQLLTERYEFRPYGEPVSLVESVAGAKPGAALLRVTGVFQNYIDQNSNGRIYPKTIWDRQLQEGSVFSERLRGRGVLGVLEHPDDGVTRIGDVSHVVTEVRYATPQEIAGSKGQLREGDILGTYEILNTSKGRDLFALHEAKVQFGVSSRGLGTVTTKGGRDIVNEDYDLDTWDVVYTPSVNRARPQALQESEPTKPASGSASESTSTPSPASTPLAEATPTNGKPKQAQTKTMSKLQEFKGLKAGALRLIKTKTKGMKPSELVVINEEAEDLILRAQTLASEDTMLTESARDLVGSIRKKLVEMDEEFDAPPEDAPPVDDDPPADGGGEDPLLVDDQAAEAINSAVELIRDELADNPEAQELADTLEDVVVHAEGDVDEDFEFTDEEVAPLGESGRRKHRKLIREHARLLKQHERLSNLTTRLLESYNAKGKGNLTESKELAVRYNRDMLKLGHAYLKAKRPDIYESNVAELKKCRTYKAFEDLTESLIKKAPKQMVTEGSNKPKPAFGSPTNSPAPKKSVTESTPKPNQSQGEQLHESVRMVNFARRRRQSVAG